MVGARLVVGAAVAMATAADGEDSVGKVAEAMAVMAMGAMATVVVTRG